MSTTTVTPNKYAGPCGRCGAKVPAGTGAYTRDTGCVHLTEADCKTTTKTWKTYVNHQAFIAAGEVRATQWAAAGFARVPELWPGTASSDLSVHGRGVVDGVSVSFIQGGGSDQDRTVRFNTVRVFNRQVMIGRFDLDREAINAARVPGEHDTTCNAEEIRQIIAAIRSFVASS